jgi:hypothetical protein
MISAITALVHCSLLVGVAFREDEFLVMSCWCLVCCYKEVIAIAGLLILFLVVCICIASRVLCCCRGLV